MSSMPNQSNNQNYLRPQNPMDRNPKPAELLKPILWAILVIAVLVTALINWEVIWDLLAEFVPAAVDLVEQGLNAVFLAILPPAIAPFAAIYVGGVLALVLAYFFLRKSIKLTKQTKQNVSAYKQVYSSLSKQWWESKRENLFAWWSTLDLMQKAAYGTGFVLIFIPMALLISVALGSAVAVLI